MKRVRCEGWWEQDLYGRQSMDNLTLQFEDERFSGSGIDVVGVFHLDGLIEDGYVYMMKHYLRMHSVRYTGTYDGEGSMQGLWHIGEFQGPWMIRIVSSIGNESKAITEWTPEAAPPKKSSSQTNGHREESPWRR